MGRNGVALLGSWDNPSTQEGGWGCGGRGAAFLPPHPIHEPEKPQSSTHLLRWPDLGLWAWGDGQGGGKVGTENGQSHPLLVP